MKRYGILPMAGKGSRLQPIGFSKELYPVTYKHQHFAVSEFSVRSMLQAMVDEIKLVVNPDKQDIAKYYSHFPAPISVYYHQSKSLPESCLYPIFSLHDDDVCLFGLPDTLFSPFSGYEQLREQLEKGVDICLGLFKVEDGSKYDSVKLDSNGSVQGVLVKKSPPLSPWIWGIWGANVKTLKLLKKEVEKQKAGRGEKLLGVAFDTLAQQKKVIFKGIELSSQYFDIGTIEAVVHLPSVINSFDSGNGSWF